MFDIAFSELMIIGIVALVVIGPERLPKVARTVGGWLGKLNRYASQVKQDIDRDMQLEELRKLQSEMKASAQKYEILAREAEEDVTNTVKTEVNHLDKVMKAMAATDGGLTLTEYEKSQAEQRALESQAAEQTENGPGADAAGSKAVAELSQTDVSAEASSPAEFQPTSLNEDLLADDVGDANRAQFTNQDKAAPSVVTPSKDA